MQSKLYIIIRDDLTPAHKAVQGGHAVAAWMSKFNYNLWNNGTLIYVTVPNEQWLYLWKGKLEALDLVFAEWYEPDLDNKLTAIAILLNEFIYVYIYIKIKLLE